MGEHPIEGLMKTAMESIKGMGDVTTVVGEAVEAKDGSLIIPVSRVSYGFAAGGAEYGEFPEDRGREDGPVGWPFGGGSGAGVTVSPVGFLVVGQGTVRMLPVDGSAIIDRVLDLAPQLVEQLRSFCSRRRD